MARKTFSGAAVVLRQRLHRPLEGDSTTPTTTSAEQLPCSATSAATRSWRDDLPVRPAADLFPARRAAS